ncbi:MAG: flavin monoamine oxidase family protein [Thiohalocapsa sp.]
MVSSGTDVLIVGGGAAGLMAARELAANGRQVTVVEARQRCGGRIHALPAAEFGYPAEAGAEFVHGAAPVTRAVMRQAGLSLRRRGGVRWDARTGSSDDAVLPHESRFYEVLGALTVDLPIAEFLEKEFGAPQYAELRRRITRTVEGYDAADPNRASTLALRAEWMARDDGEHGRIGEGYGALIDFLASDCRRRGVSLHLGVPIDAVEEGDAGVLARSRDGGVFTAAAAIIAIPLPLLSEIALPPAARARVAEGDIGFGNVIKLLLRFKTKWWADIAGGTLADLSFVVSDAAVPTWWTQHPEPYPVLTGWLAGPRADRHAGLSESALVGLGLASLAEIFALPVDRLAAELAAARAVDWGSDPFARGAYSYATPATRAAQAALKRADGSAIHFSGEALYDGPDMGTVEAALASGQDTARTILAGG